MDFKIIGSNSIFIQIENTFSYKFGTPLSLLIAANQKEILEIFPLTES